jgi:hypothetical protein
VGIGGTGGGPAVATLARGNARRDVLRVTLGDDLLDAEVDGRGG